MSQPIPQPPGIPLLGNLFDVNPSNTWASLAPLAHKYPEIFQLKILGKTLVFVSGAALAQEVCDERRFRKYVGGPIVEIRYAVHDALFTAYDDEASWGVAHRICAPRLAPEAVGPWCGEMVDCVEALVGKWRRQHEQEQEQPHRRKSEVGGLVTVEKGKTTTRTTTTTDGGSADDYHGGGGGVLLMDELNRLNLETTTWTLFGKQLGCIDAPAAHPMLAGMETATSEAMKRPTRPSLLNWLLFGAKFRKATATMRAYAADLVQTRQQEQQQQQQLADHSDNVDDDKGKDKDKDKDNHHHHRRRNRQDLLAALMEGTDPLTGQGLTESQVIDEIVSMPIGSSTAPCLLASMVYFLLQNPHCLQKARKELDEVLGPRHKTTTTTTTTTTGSSGASSGGLGVEDLSRLHYLQGIVRESLRLSAAAPGFNIEPIPRRVVACPHDHAGNDGGDGSKVLDKTPILLGGGRYQIAHDQALIVVLSGVNRDPAVFADPLAFRPERMMGPAFEALPPGVKKWFGNGKRECIGRHWAWQFTMVVAAVLIREVDFEMGDPGYEMRQDGWFNIRPVDFWVKARPRPREL